MSLASLKAKLNIRRYLDILLGVAFLVTLVLVVMVTVRISRGVTRTVQTPAHFIRLQVLNATNIANLDAKMAKYLDGYRNAEVEIRVVDKSNFDLRNVPRSFIIGRENDRAAAELLARTVGLDPSEVVYRPLEDNTRQVSATLVLGDDYQMVKLPSKSTKE